MKNILFGTLLVIVGLIMASTYTDGDGITFVAFGAIGGAAIGATIGATIGGIGVALCGTGFGIPAGVVVVGIGALCAAGGGVIGNWFTDEPAPMFTNWLTIPVIIAGVGFVGYGIFAKIRKKPLRQ